MSDKAMEEFIKQVAHDATWEAVDSLDTEAVIRRVLKRRLLKLLEAGHAYYKEPPGIDQKYHDAYVTALQAARGPGS